MTRHLNDFPSRCTSVPHPFGRGFASHMIGKVVRRRAERGFPYLVLRDIVNVFFTEVRLFKPDISCGIWNSGDVENTGTPHISRVAEKPVEGIFLEPTSQTFLG